jgi:uncharacterized membrane protein
MYSIQAHPKNEQQNTNNKYRGIHIDNFRLTIFLSLALCVSFFLFYVSRPTGSITAIVAFHNLVKIITGMYKENILTSNIDLSTSVGIYMYILG